jgi:phosphoadenosine phosphosulfate reductase
MSQTSVSPAPASAAVAPWARCLDPAYSYFDLDAINADFARKTAQQRIEWSLDNLPAVHVLSSSFGAQAAVMLHMVTRARPDIPVILLDTGHLFPETYEFVASLTARLNLNLRTYRALMEPAQQESLYGRLWEQGKRALERYNRMNKVEPLERAFAELKAATWFSGLRRSQAVSRSEIDFVQRKDPVLKVHPIADWTDRDIGIYLKKHALPYHPLWDRGYVSIGDWHSTRSLAEAGDAEATRFNGLQRECGIHGLPG